MKISERKFEANRRNSKLGAEASRQLADERYKLNPSFCTNCQELLPRQKKNNKFCSQSCAATYHNSKRKGKKQYERPSCRNCGDETARRQSLYCSRECSSAARIFRTDEERRVARNETSARYRARLRGQVPADADLTAIKEFYANCPTGHEVDHRIPISKGGLHSIENLQYLTVSENRSKGNRI